jgi:mannose-6-phosphate isomerase-like protein (cupin superfamily)
MGNNKEKKSGLPEWMGNLPCPPDKKRPCFLKGDNIKETVYGKGNKPITITVLADTDRFYFSEYSIKPGSWFEPPDIHEGDEIYYCLSGEATMYDPVHGETIVLKPGDGFIIPQGVWHVGYNFGSENFRLITVIAPKAWSDLNVSFEGKQAFYKGE